MIRATLLDRLVLQPNRDPLEAEGAERIELPLGPKRSAQLWVRRVSGPRAAADARPIVVLKYPGTSGRAEQAGPQPLSLWPDRSGIVAAVNPPGYGRAAGRATLRDGRRLVDAVAAETARRWPDALVLVWGNSLGSLRTLDHASRHPVDGISLRNPPPLERLIERGAERRGGRWLAGWLLAGLGPEWHSLALAERVKVPALVIQSERDSIVPKPLQDELLARLAGPQRRLLLAGADHADPIPEAAWPELQSLLAWWLASCEQASSEQASCDRSS
ncbi:MAG TPA: hypothetical protein DCQ98_15560 [Planctomycetaceae bacterium]|nr:hypothetical protein [Planctomycetaceae bacterium]